MSVSGYIAKPVVARNNRSFEIFFVNGHAVKDKILEKAVEAAYRPFLMQHKFPFVYLFLTLDPGMVDVNVHPRKSEVKFALANTVFDFIERAAEDTLKRTELINKITLAPEEKAEYIPDKDSPEPFESSRIRTDQAVCGSADAVTVIDHLKGVRDKVDTGAFC